MENIQKCVRRQPYKNNTKELYDNLKEKGYFLDEIEFSSKPDKSDVENLNTQNTRVWLLFGKKESESAWECLQVAHSKRNVRTEIEEDIGYLFPEEALSSVEGFSNSVFYENVCPKCVNKEDYRKCLYGIIGKSYNEFRVCCLNVDKYLGLETKNTAAITDAERIIEICKNQYAEAKIAYETLAKYWKLYSSGIDGQTIAYFVKNK